MKEQDNHKIIELLRRPEFKQWVLRPTEESNYLWQRWMREHPEDREAVFKAREIILRIRFKKRELSKADIDTLFDKIVKSSNKYNGRKPSIFNIQWIKYAAVLFMVFVASFLLLKSRESKISMVDSDSRTSPIIRENPKGQKSIIHLADGSTVHLNANSTLTYGQDFENNRLLELTGEAYFLVEKDPDHPFVVKSGNLLTTALGTQFNINTKGKKLEVLLVEGKVQVTTTDNVDEVRILDQLQTISYGAETGLSQVVSVENLDAILWKEGIMHFDDTPMPVVLETLEDWYAVEIVAVGDYSRLKYSGTFKNEILDNVFKSMAFSTGLEYKLKDKNVELKF